MCNKNEWRDAMAIAFAVVSFLTGLASVYILKDTKR